MSIVLPRINAQGVEYVDLDWNSKSPTIELRDNKNPRISLPLEVKTLIKKSFPDFRVPGNQDYQGDWSENYARSGSFSPSQILENKVPFVAVGDFNHDGLMDIAMFIIDQHEANTWKLVVFHGGKDGYRFMVLVSSPEDRSNDPRRGRHYGPVQKFAVVPKSKCTDGLFCVALEVNESGEFEYIWKGHSYLEKVIHD